jgi:AraC-like DNA-binding protein
LRSGILYCLFWLASFNGFCQDTVFVAKHFFSTPVRNVLKVNEDLFVKTGDGLYKLDGKRWELQKMKFEKGYLFYDKGFIEADYLPDKYVFNAKPMAYLIPQKSIDNASKADLGSRLFVATGGSLFEYFINNNYWHGYEGASVRDIFLEDGLKVISTYSGIFVNDSIKLKDPNYSNGYLQKIGNRYFLSSDNLYEFKPPAELRKIPSGVNVFAGYSRKLMEFRNNLYALNTKSVNRMDTAFNLMPVHQGYEYYDMEVVGDRLLFCTQSGEVFAYDGNKVQLLVKLDTRIRDIYAFKNTIYLSSDKGVYTIEGLDPKTLSTFQETPFTVMVLVDALRNTWISTENGLYLLPDKKKDPILYIKDIEFNRGALTLRNDSIWVGSITGLYVIDCYDVVKSFLPVYFNRIKADQTQQIIRWAIYFLAIVVVFAGSAFVYREYQKRNAKFTLPQKEIGPALTLEQVAEDIRTNNIMTVEGLAEFYKTNTVQLNRQFKAFDTTPGKFMKAVKIEYAREMLDNKVSIEDVVSKIGYSASFIKSELKKSGRRTINS